MCRLMTRPRTSSLLYPRKEALVIAIELVLAPPATATARKVSGHQ